MKKTVLIKLKITQKNNNLILSDISCFDVALSLDCGQAFRWNKNDDGIWHGVINGCAIDIEQKKDAIIFYNTTKNQYDDFLENYFDLKRDYKKITDLFSDDVHLNQAVREFYGIRVLNQEPWETLCSFIISQNNNIPRIKGIISRLCENFGEQISENDFSFPSSDIIAKKSVEDLSVLRAGFRAKYIIDAAKKVTSGEVDLENIKNMSLEDGRKELMKISGVGPKVAECVLLYSCLKTQAFPIDVWVKRVVGELYPDGLPVCMGEYKGIAQQYLFHWRRNSEKFR